MYTAQGKIDHSDMLAEYAPLVRRLALQLIARLPASVELDDLIQAGMLGLLDAATRYQANQGAQFKTYATQRIQGAMLDELRANDWLPRGLRQSARGVEAAVQALEQKLARAPTEAEIARELGMSLEDYQRLLQDVHGCQLVYYEDFDTGGGEDSFLDQHSDIDRGDEGVDRDGLLEKLFQGGLRDVLAAAIEAIPERERLVLSLYYEQELTLREIGAILEITQSRVCQLRSQAVSRLRARLRGTAWQEAV